MLLLQKPRAKITRHRRSYFQLVSADIPGAMGIGFSKNNFLYCDQARANHMEILSGVKYVFITDVLQLTLRTAWSFLVYVHYASFSIHLGNFIKLKKSNDRYSAFDPLFALVWCRQLSNDTKYRAGWLYSEITDWAKRDFVPNKKGGMGYFLCFFLNTGKTNVHLCETMFCLFMESIRESVRYYSFTKVTPAFFSEIKGRLFLKKSLHSLSNSVGYSSPKGAQPLKSYNELT